MVYVTVQNVSNQGLLFSGVGETYFTIANSGSLGAQTNVYFTIYPLADFNSLAFLETTFENASNTVDIVVKVQPSVTVPANGMLVIAFPTIAEDGTTVLFDNYLGKAGLYPGAAVDCATNPTGITTFTSCTINSNFKKVWI